MRCTSSTVWCTRGRGRGGPRTPISGFDRSKPSVTAQEIAERNTSHRPDTVATDDPHACQRTITRPQRSRGERQQRPPTERVSNQTGDDVTVRGIRGRLPQMRAGDEPLQQLRDVNPGMSDDPTRSTQ
jgi:hypothetical protein